MGAVTTVLVLLATLHTAVRGQILSFGSCPTVEVQENFDIMRYLGKWYENARTFAIFEAGAQCAKANYSMKADGHVKVVNSAKWRQQVVGDAYAPDPNEPAKLKVKFSWWQPRGNYWVVETDYDDYAVVYSCSGIGRFLHWDIAWLLTRSRQGIAADKKEAIFNRLRQFGIDPKRFKDTIQTDCDTP